MDARRFWALCFCLSFAAGSGWSDPIVEATFEQLSSWMGVSDLSLSVATNDVSVYRCEGGLTECLYDAKTRTIRYPAGASVDAVRHEAAHAFLHLVKPGWDRGVSLVIHEAFADTVAVLLAYLHDGDLSRGVDDAATIQTGVGARSAANTETVDTLGFDPHRRHMLEIRVPKTLCDPYHVSQIPSGFIHDVFELRLKEVARDGDGANAVGTKDEVVRAAHEVGNAMTRSLFYLGEHRVSLYDFAVAMAIADQTWSEGVLSGHIEAACRLRGILRSDQSLVFEPPSGPATATGRPLLRLDPELSADVLPDLLVAYDEAQLCYLDSLPLSQRIAGAAFSLPLLYHRAATPHAEVVSQEEVVIDRAFFLAGGMRVVRIRYVYPIESIAEREYDLASGGDRSLLSRFEWRRSAYASYLFDPNGQLVIAHVDRPLVRQCY